MKLPNFLKIEPGLGKYYLFFGALTLLLGTVIGINVVGSYDLKYDYKFEKQFSDISQKIQDYTSANRRLPELLVDVGVEQTDGVTYSRVSNTRYTLCAVFKTKSDGYVTDFGFRDEILSEGANIGASLDSDASYYKSDGGQLKHEKGYSCVVYEPYNLSATYIQDFLCGGYLRKTSFIKHGPYVITSVDAANRIITFDSFTAVPPPAGSNGLTLQTKTLYTLTIAPTAELYTAQCKKIVLSEFAAGDTFVYYTSTYSGTAPNIPSAVQKYDASIMY